MDSRFFFLQTLFLLRSGYKKSTSLGYFRDSGKRNFDIRDLPFTIFALVFCKVPETAFVRSSLHAADYGHDSD